MQPYRELSWSPAEKRIARAAFKRALLKEKEAAIREFKERVGRIHDVKDIDELWELEGWLRNRRKAIDEKYDYRYSVLVSVFEHLLAEGRIEESDLAGLGREKIEEIHRLGAVRRELAGM